MSIFGDDNDGAYGERGAGDDLGPHQREVRCAVYVDEAPAGPGQGQARNMLHGSASDSSSSSESEDLDAEELTPQVELDILKTIQMIRKKTRKFTTKTRLFLLFLLLLLSRHRLFLFFLLLLLKIGKGHADSKITCGYQKERGY